MNVTLGSGKAVHAAHIAADGEVQNFPTCGGNKAGERYTGTGREVTCKKCLKKLAAQAEATPAEPVAELCGVQLYNPFKGLGFCIKGKGHSRVTDGPEHEGDFDAIDAAHAEALAENGRVTEVAETVIELDMVEPTKGFVAISGHGVVGTVLHTELRGGVRGDGWAAEGEDGIEAVSRTWDKARAATLLARHLGFEGPLRVRINIEYSNA